MTQQPLVGDMVKKAKPAKKYQPDLSEFLVVCERNYAQMMRLLPAIAPQGQLYEFFVSEQLHYEVTIVECSKFTTVVQFRQLQQGLAEYLVPSLDVRLYHDAQLAEVIASKHLRNFKPRYSYPNPNMLQADEKRQLNLFLYEWLKFVLAHGRAWLDWSKLFT